MRACKPEKERTSAWLVVPLSLCAAGDGWIKFVISGARKDSKSQESKWASPASEGWGRS